MNDIGNLQSTAASQTVKAIYSSPTVTCECGSKVFHEAVVLKKVSGLLSGTGKDELVPIPVYVCDKCGKIPVEFTSRSAAKMILGEDTEQTEEKSNLIK